MELWSKLTDFCQNTTSISATTLQTLLESIITAYQREFNSASICTDAQQAIILEFVIILKLRRNQGY